MSRSPADAKSPSPATGGATGTTKRTVVRSTERMAMRVSASSAECTKDHRLRSPAVVETAAEEGAEVPLMMIKIPNRPNSIADQPKTLVAYMAPNTAMPFTPSR